MSRIIKTAYLEQNFPSVTTDGTVELIPLVCVNLIEFPFVDTPMFAGGAKADNDSASIACNISATICAHATDLIYLQLVARKTTE